MMESLGKLLARIPIDSHELGELISVEERVEAIEAKLDSLVARVKQLEKTDDERSEEPQRRRR